MTQEEQLKNLRQTLDDQHQQMTTLQEEMRLLGLEGKEPKMDALSPEERERMYEFERKLHAITASLTDDSGSTTNPCMLHSMV